MDQWSKQRKPRPFLNEKFDSWKYKPLAQTYDEFIENIGGSKGLSRIGMLEEKLKNTDSSVIEAADVSFRTWNKTIEGGRNAPGGSGFWDWSRNNDFKSLSKIINDPDLADHGDLRHRYNFIKEYNERIGRGRVATGDLPSGVAQRKASLTPDVGSTPSKTAADASPTSSKPTTPKPVPNPEVTPRMLKGVEDLKIERQGLGASFYEGEEWERLVKGGIPNEFRTYGTNFSSNNTEQAKAYGRLRAAQMESRGIKTSNVGPEAYSGFEGSFFDKTGNVLGGSSQQRRMYDTVNNLRRGVEDTSYIVDPNGGIKIIGLDTTGRPGAELYNIPPDVMTPELMENIRKLGLPQIEYKRGGGPIYASKGMFVPKGPDTIPAMLAPNEFVVNGQSAINNLDLLKQINASRGPLYMNQGGIVSGSSPAQAENYYGTLGGNNQTNQMGNNFAGYVEQLQNFQFPTIPERIEMVGSHTVDVNVNGAGAFESLQGGIMNMINSEIGKTMDGLWNQSNGAVGRASR
jgi:hypothetical protein